MLDIDPTPGIALEVVGMAWDFQSQSMHKSDRLEMRTKCSSEGSRLQMPAQLPKARKYSESYPLLANRVVTAAGKLLRVAALHVTVTKHLRENVYFILKSSFQIKYTIQMESLQGFVFVPVAAVIAIVYTWMVTDVSDENRFKEVIKNAVLVAILVSVAVMLNSSGGLASGMVDDFMTGPADL